MANVDLCSNLIQQVKADYFWSGNLKQISFFQIPSVIFALFLGPWSDRAGRKLLIMFPYLGFFLVCLSMILNVYFFKELYVEFLWLENLSAFFGSYVIFLIGCYGFIADTTDQESRTIRIAVMDGCIFSTNIIGNYVNGPIYKKFDYFGSFGGGAICFALGFCLVGLFFKEPKIKRGNKDKEEGSSSILSLSNLANSFGVLVKRRRGSLRHIVVLLYACFTVGNLTNTGMDFLFFRCLYLWPQFDHTCIVSFRKKFAGSWSNENDMITWYNHLRWSPMHHNDIDQ